MRERLLIAVYTMSNRRHGTLYIGVTSNLVCRAEQHRDGVIEGFTKKYGLKRLVWYEEHQRIDEAIRREKALKKYKRDWKANLVERENPHWEDLYPGLLRRPGGNGWPGRASLRPAMTMRGLGTTDVPQSTM